MEEVGLIEGLTGRRGACAVHWCSSEGVWHVTIATHGWLTVPLRDSLWSCLLASCYYHFLGRRGGREGGREHLGLKVALEEGSPR